MAPPAMSLLIKYVQKVRLLVATVSLTFDHVCAKPIINQARDILGFPGPRHPFRSWIEVILPTANPEPPVGRAVLLE